MLDSNICDVTRMRTSFANGRRFRLIFSNNFFTFLFIFFSFGDLAELYVSNNLFEM